MSEPDAVPLPRDGAVFFDVRGEARCMRLSWYADSAVAVFSIWQGNRCTGTFRLPFADLGRMARALQSGPGKPAVTDRPDHGHRDSLASQRYSTGQHYGAGERETDAYPRDPYAQPDYNLPDHGDAPWQVSTQA